MPSPQNICILLYHNRQNKLANQLSLPDPKVAAGLQTSSIMSHPIKLEKYIHKWEKATTHVVVLLVHLIAFSFSYMKYYLLKILNVCKNFEDFKYPCHANFQHPRGIVVSKSNTSADRMRQRFINIVRILLFTEGGETNPRHSE